jgi:hypothetical protein
MTKSLQYKFLEELKLFNVYNSERKKHKTSIHVAILVFRGKIISKATNALGSRSQGCGYSNCTIHAERNVIKKLGDYRKIKNADLYVTRYGANNTLLNSTPCPDCTYFLNKCIDKYGLRFIYYTV